MWGNWSYQFTTITNYFPQQNQAKHNQERIWWAAPNTGIWASPSPPIHFTIESPLYWHGLFDSIAPLGGVKDSRRATHEHTDQGPLLLALINFNPSMDT